MKHGEAVAIGMLCEAYISHKLLGLTNEELHQIVAFVEKNYTYYDSQWDEKELIVFMHNDKKNLNGKFNLTLLKKIGKAKIDMDCSSELISESLSFYQNLKHNFPTQHSA
ncbi:MAG: hypothetical protein NTU43_10725 [Bacteroidetes bacterium]|nr:hypothetical protein [Bacteroidota bacterium]